MTEAGHCQRGRGGGGKKSEPRPCPPAIVLATTTTRKWENRTNVLEVMKKKESGQKRELIRR